MAARKDLRHSDEVRAKIQTSQLVNRLSDHVNGAVEMSQTQLKAAEILLKKSLPDLSAVTIGGDADNPLHIANSGARETLESKFAGKLASLGTEEPSSKPH